MLEGPRRRPLLTLVTHVPLLALWIVFACGDVADGHIRFRGNDMTAGSGAGTFTAYALLIVGLALVFGFRAIYALLVLAGLEPRKKERE